MGTRYKEEEPFAFYDPELDRQGERQDAVNSRSGPPPISPRDRPFGHYDPELDGEEEDQGPPTRYLDSERDPSSQNEVDSRGMARGAHPPLPYINQDFGGSAPGPGYGGRGAPTRPDAPQLDQEFAGTSGSGRGRSYGDASHHPHDGNGRTKPAPGDDYPRPVRPPHVGEVLPGPGAPLERPAPGGGEAGYPGPLRPSPADEGLHGRGAPWGRGRGSSGPPLGTGEYVYGGLQQPYVPELQEYGAPPAPVSSEYAHQVYASVFTDPVYGGAVQFNPKAGYSEEPANLQQLHHRQDVLRHPDQF